MTPVDRRRLVEPTDFDTSCRAPGNQWLKANPSARRARDLWSPFKAQLAEGFSSLCAYSAMYEPVGTVDHFVSVDEDRTLAYEWANYRYASAWVNSSKSRTRTGEILDPLIVSAGWFRILLPSLQLAVTDRIPLELRALAEGTLRRLHLEHDERVMRQRRQWYSLYQSGDLSFAGLRQMAPLVADAVSNG